MKNYCQSKSFLLSLSLSLFLLLLTLTFTGGCSSSAPKGKTDAEVLYQEAVKNMQKERYLLATEKLNTLKSQHPYSYYATHAELLLADILFLQENYIESAAAYLSFKDLHPKHEKIAYVIWKTAESYYKQLPSTYDRDLSPAKEALKYYNDILVRFPNSPYDKETRERIQSIEEMLKQQEIYIADFYFKTDIFDSARFRYIDIISKYNDQKVQDHAMLRIVKSSLNLKEYSDCGKYADDYMEKVSSAYKSEIVSLKEQCSQKEQKTKQ
ncbi:MAG: outer membrane protein assembly factor BamD [Oligoflexia bacterium]|nr:outer membrane protein assembly factor BamD [Oligoflexia bacterium]MBF0366120.1 outer membrane protein assembly factor BamD [Oligoflexia bacterium]